MDIFDRLIDELTLTTIFRRSQVTAAVEILRNHTDEAEIRTILCRCSACETDPIAVANAIGLGMKLEWLRI